MKDQIIAQINEAAETLGSTFGPYGKYALITKGDTFFTRDGVTVAKALDSNKKPGISLVVDACNATVRAAGDGTTSTALLCAALINLKKDPMPYMEGIISQIKGMAFPPSKEELVKVATGSAHNEQMGRLIAECAYELGEDGHIRAQYGLEDKIEVEPGYNLGSGALVPQFMSPKPMPNVHSQNGQVTIENPLVLLIEEKIATHKAMAPVIEQYIQIAGQKDGSFSRPLVIVVADMEMDALRFMVGNFMERNPPAPVFLVAAPAKGMERYNILEDIRYVTGAGKVYSKYSGFMLKQFSGDFGSARQVILGEKDGEFSCRIITPGADMDSRIAHIKKTQAESPARAERISKLKGAVGVITFGPGLHAESKNRQLIVEDTVLACMNTLKYGFIPGGKKLWGDILPSIAPELEEAFKVLADKLPTSESLDSVYVIENVIRSSFSLAEQIYYTEKII